MSAPGRQQGAGQGQVKNFLSSGKKISCIFSGGWLWFPIAKAKAQANRRRVTVPRTGVCIVAMANGRSMRKDFRTGTWSKWVVGGKISHLFSAPSTTRRSKKISPLNGCVSRAGKRAF